MKGCSAIFRHAIRIIGYDSDVLISVLLKEIGGQLFKRLRIATTSFAALLTQPTHHERCDTLILSIEH